MALRTRSSLIGRFARIAGGAFFAASALALAAGPADAHLHRHAYRHVAAHVHYGHTRYAGRAFRHRGAAFVSASPAFSALVIDANSGATLYSVDPDGLRHPASITKVMTLYLLFEQLDSGAMTLRSRIPVSEHAAAQEPSKLGVAPGDTISVEDAIKAVVTRSANDIAVAIAEAIGHDEPSFAEMMTRKARALGMENTTYRNASGLPNDEQITTAHDLSILARSLEDRFPRYFKYFSTESFAYGGETIGNHNHLLGRIDGVDGIKTGYTRASGFNLLTSVHRDGRSLVAVVMGGRTAGQRDRTMAGLIKDHLAQGSTVRTANMVADASSSQDDAAEPAPVEAARAPARTTPVAASVPTRLAAKAANTDGEGDDAGDDAQPTLKVAALRTAAAPDAAAAAPARAALRVAAALRLPQAASEQKARQADASSPTPPARPKVADAAVAPVKSTGTTVAARSTSEDAVAAAPHEDSDSVKGWKIQVGATDDPGKAAALLDKARARDRALLAAAKPLTEKVRKGEDTFYRARFAGLDSETADAACRSLKRSGFSCFATRD